ncbi:hypothetical protein ACE6H2_022508 [Prunus campanulata]
MELMARITSFEDLKKIKSSLDSFDKIVEEVKAVSRDPVEQDQLLTERIVFDLIQSQARKAEASISKQNNYNQEKAASTSAGNYHMKIRKQSLGSSKDEDEYKCIEEKVSKLIKKKQNKAKKAVSMRSALSSIPSPPPDMPTEFKNKIQSLHGFRVQLVIQKEIFRTDLSSHHDRLSMPKNQVSNQDFLGEQDKKKLKLEGSIRVKVIDPNLNEYELRLSEWKFKSRSCSGLSKSKRSSSSSFVLNSGWSKISENKKNKLEKKDIIQVWSFRVNNDDNPPIYGEERLCFAVVKLTDTDTD